MRPPREYSIRRPATTRGGFPTTLGVDLLLTAAILGLSFVSVLQSVVRDMRPAPEYTRAHADRLGRDAGDLRKLDPAESRGPWRDLGEEMRQLASRPPSEDQIRRLTEAARVMRQNAAAMGPLGEARDQVMESRLRRLGETLMAFWEMRACELCVKERPPPPTWPDPAGPAERLIYLEQLTAYGDEVWELYLTCQEKTVVIGEDLLHFKVDRDNQFESDPKPGFRKIESYVDANIATHKHVYIVGHTDERYYDDYNDKLSYRRASYVASKVREHLKSKGKEEGRDYAIYPVGMGKKQPVPAVEGESLADFWTRCRRIEIQFRSGTGGTVEAARR